MSRQLHVPLSTSRYSAKATFDDMTEGEIRYFHLDHLQLFRVFSGRIKNQRSDAMQCLISFDDDCVTVQKST